MDQQIRADLIRDRLGTTAFAFCGYNNTNLGRTAESRASGYGPVIEHYLREDSEACSGRDGVPIRPGGTVVRGRKLARHLCRRYSADRGGRTRRRSRIVQGILRYRLSPLATRLGYSIGEIAALVCSGSTNCRTCSARLLYLVGRLHRARQDRDDGGRLLWRGPAWIWTRFSGCATRSRPKHTALSTCPATWPRTPCYLLASGRNDRPLQGADAKALGKQV